MHESLTIRYGGIRWIDGHQKNERIGVYLSESDQIIIGFKREINGKEISDTKRVIKKIPRNMHIYGLSDDIYHVAFEFGYYYRTKSEVHITVKTIDNTEDTASEVALKAIEVMKTLDLEELARQRERITTLISSME